MVNTVRCDHCGVETKHPVTKIIDGRALNFCCRGCLSVYELLHEEGGNEKGTPVLPLADPVQIVDRQYGETISSKTITLSIGGMTCANCVAHVEGGLRSVPGVLNVNVNLTTERATVEMIPGAVTIADLKQAVEDVGYEVLRTGDTIT